MFVQSEPKAQSIPINSFLTKSTFGHSEKCPINVGANFLQLKKEQKSFWIILAASVYFKAKNSVKKNISFEERTNLLRRPGVI